MKEQISQQLFNYWNTVRAGRLAPRRFEIEPSSLAGILPDTFILEQIDSQTARFRLAGTRICEAFGAEIRGANFVDLFTGEDKKTLLSQFHLIAKHGAAGRLTVTAATASGETARFEITLLPLLHTGETVDRFLGSMAPDQVHAWFGIEPVVKLQIDGLDLIWPDGKPHKMAELAARQAPFAPHVREARIVRSDRRHFRVYDGGLNSGRDDR